MVFAMSNRVRSLAILGGAPSGSYLGALLARQGVNVGIYDTGKRPEIIVGESLVPAIVPFLQDLGIEDEVRGYSIHKPGATFVLRGGEEIMNLRFDEIRGAKTDYSYNVPRTDLDASFQRAAIRDGAKLIPHTGRVEVESGSERLRLTDESLEAGREVFGHEQPDFIVDATGRRRMVANLLKIPHQTGPRRDAALHAHLEGVGLIECGNVHTDLLETGWSWRIPLPGRVSVGLVIDGDTLSSFGDTNEEQFDNYDRYQEFLENGFTGDASNNNALGLFETDAVELEDNQAGRLEDRLDNMFGPRRDSFSDEEQAEQERARRNRGAGGVGTIGLTFYVFDPGTNRYSSFRVFGTSLDQFYPAD